MGESGEERMGTRKRVERGEQGANAPLLVFACPGLQGTRDMGLNGNGLNA